MTAQLPKATQNAGRDPYPTTFIPAIKEKIYENTTASTQAMRIPKVTVYSVATMKTTDSTRKRWRRAQGARSPL